MPVGNANIEHSTFSVQPRTNNRMSAVFRLLPRSSATVLKSRARSKRESARHTTELSRLLRARLFDARRRYRNLKTALGEGPCMSHVDDPHPAPSPGVPGE